MTEAQEALKGLLAAIANKPDDVPPHMRTAAQWAREWGKSKDWAMRAINKGIEAGVWEAKSYAIANAAGVVRPFPHYGPKKVKK